MNQREKGGKAVALPCHHNLEAYLHAYLDGTVAWLAGASAGVPVYGPLTVIAKAGLTSARWRVAERTGRTLLVTGCRADIRHGQRG